MLSSAETIDVIAETLQTHKVPVIVLDPVCQSSCSPKYYSNQHQQVMVSTSGSKLLPEKAVKELRTKLLPLTTILTPNIPEALLLLKDAGAEASEPKDLEGMVELAKKICSLGPKAVLLKGGHLPLTKDHKASQDPKEGTSSSMERQPPCSRQSSWYPRIPTVRAARLLQQLPQTWLLART